MSVRLKLRMCSWVACLQLACKEPWKKCNRHRSLAQPGNQPWCDRIPILSLYNQWPRHHLYATPSPHQGQQQYMMEPLVFFFNVKILQRESPLWARHILFSFIQVSSKETWTISNITYCTTPLFVHFSSANPQYYCETNGSFRVKKLKKKIDTPQKWFVVLNYHQWIGLCWFLPFLASQGPPLGPEGPGGVLGGLENPKLPISTWDQFQVWDVKFST